MARPDKIKQQNMVNFATDLRVIQSREGGWVRRACIRGGSVPLAEISGARATISSVMMNAAERALDLRRHQGINLSGAVIWASAQIHALLLVTCNTKDLFSRATRASGCLTRLKTPVVL